MKTFTVYLGAIVLLVSCSKTETETVDSFNSTFQSDFSTSSENRLMVSAVVTGEYDRKSFNGKECPPDGDMCCYVKKELSLEFEDDILDFEEGILNGPVTMKEYFEQEMYIPLSVNRPDIFSDYTSGAYSAIKVTTDSLRRYLFGINPTPTQYKYEIQIDL